MSQLRDLATHLQKRKISRLIAMYEYGIANLWARCAELEEMGFTINRQWVNSTNRHGNSSRHMIYSMSATKKNQALFKKLYAKNNK